MLGKKVRIEGSDSIAIRGACTITCPAACKSIATTWCKCKNDKYANRGSSYQTDYNKVIQSYRTPDFS